MDGISSALDQSNLKSPKVISYRSVEATYSYQEVVIQNTLGVDNDDQVSLGIPGLKNGLSVSAEEIIKKINERLKVALPEGVESLKPEDSTPDATAERIVKGVTALFDVFAKRHPELEGEELLKGFMDTIRAGVDEGYDDAANFLEGIGAFEIDGVKDGIETTKKLIEEKLKAFEKKKAEELGLTKDSELQSQASGLTSDSLLAQIGKGISVHA